jgi:hypothetical protein
MVFSSRTIREDRWAAAAHRLNEDHPASADGVHARRLYMTNEMAFHSCSWIMWALLMISVDVTLDVFAQQHESYVRSDSLLESLSEVSSYRYMRRTSQPQCVMLTVNAALV